MDAGADDDVALALQARRLMLSAELTRRAMRCAGTSGRVGESGPALLDLASLLAEVGTAVERAHRLRFDPPYPGATSGVQETRGGRRLLHACRALGEDGGAWGVVFTSLIAGRAPQVTVAPAVAPLPAPGGEPDR